MTDDHGWINEWYTELEKGLTKYKRPDDWKERMLTHQNKVRKPVRNQFEGKRSTYHEEY